MNFLSKKVYASTELKNGIYLHNYIDTMKWSIVLNYFITFSILKNVLHTKLLISLLGLDLMVSSHKNCLHKQFILETFVRFAWTGEGHVARPLVYNIL
jgi:hypothetical protein